MKTRDSATRMGPRKSLANVILPVIFVLVSVASPTALAQSNITELERIKSAAEQVLYRT